MSYEKSGLEKQLDKVFSSHIRLKDADPDGYVKCCTCPAVKHWIGMDCGHYRKRRHMATRWLVENCGPQCRECNSEKQGNDVEFEKYLKYKYGPNHVDYLIKLSHTIVHYTKEDLLKLIEKFI